LIDRYQGYLSGRAGAHGRAPREETVMAQEDKANNKAQELKGKVKETVGKAVGNESLTAEGKFDQTAGNLKNAGEKVKDAFRD
jgi:uncharacterized protein YjbJ (UPF0337 family)